MVTFAKDAVTLIIVSEKNLTQNIARNANLMRATQPTQC